MPTLYKISFAILLVTISVEGKVKKEEKILPIEVILNPKNVAKSTTPSTKFSKNKAIQLKIHSDDSEEGGKVDLIIAATKEVLATERSIDRYSPEFNSEYNLLDAESNEDSNSYFSLNKKSDISRQDSPFYSSETNDLFPFLMLRHILQTPQPLVLGRNQFSPSQNLRLLEDNLQREISHQNLIGPNQNFPFRVVVSQPLFTGGVSPDARNQQRHQNQNQIFQLLPHRLRNIQPAHPVQPIQHIQPGQHMQPVQKIQPFQHIQSIQHIQPIQRVQPIQALNQNQPFTHPQSVPSAHNLPLNRNSLLNNFLQSKFSLQNKNSALTNALSKNFENNNLHLSEPERIQPPLRDQPSISQTLPNNLGRDKQPLPVYNRPRHISERNQQIIPLRNVYQQGIISQNANNLQSLPNVGDQNTQNFQQNRGIQLIQLRTTSTPDLLRNTHYNSQLPTSSHHQTSTDGHSSSRNININNQQQLYRPQNSQTAEGNSYNDRRNSLQGTDMLQGNYQPHLKVYITDPQRLNLPIQQPITHHHTQLQQSLRNDLNSPPLRSLPSPKVQEDDRKVPVYHHSPEGLRPLYYRRYQTVPGASYDNRFTDDNSEPVHGSNHQHVPPTSNHRQSYEEPPVESHSESTSYSRSGSSAESEESSYTSTEMPSHKENYGSSTPVKKRKRNRKRNQASDKFEDLEGHSSHQYIIKIG